MSRIISYIVFSIAFSTLIAAVSTTYVNATNVGTLKQFIAPLECVKEVINDGVSEEVILSPQECDDLLHPKPPIDNGGHPQHPHPNPTSPNPSPNAPNTGGMQRFMDAVHESGIVPIAITFALALIVRKVYRVSKP